MKASIMIHVNKIHMLKGKKRENNLNKLAVPAAFPELIAFAFVSSDSCFGKSKQVE